MAKVTIKTDNNRISTTPGIGATLNSDGTYTINTAGTINASCYVGDFVPSRDWYCKGGEGVPEHSQFNNNVIYYLPTNSFYVYGHMNYGGCTEAKIIVYLQNKKTITYTISKNVKKFPYVIPFTGKAADIHYYEVVCGQCVFTSHVGYYDSTCDWIKNENPILRFIDCLKLPEFGKTLHFEVMPTTKLNNVSVLSPDQTYIHRVWSNIPCGNKLTLQQYLGGDDPPFGWIRLDQPDKSLIVKINCQ